MPFALQDWSRSTNAMKEFWSNDKTRHTDRRGKRWHFVQRYIFETSTPCEDPYELYFRNDDGSEYGVLRFERRKDNPYRDYNLVVTKIMNNRTFRRTLLDPETKAVWRKNWK